MTVQITSFETLLDAARQEPEPQRLLLVFLKTVLPKEHTEEEARRFQEGQGGGLHPVFCVDLGPDELTTFADLVTEADQMESEWQLVLVACLSGKGGKPPPAEEAEQWMTIMQKSVIGGGDLSRYLAFNRSGEPVRFG